MNSRVNRFISCFLVSLFTVSFALGQNILPSVQPARPTQTAEITPENEAIVGHIYSVIAKIAAREGFADSFRVVTNNGETAGQTVMHLHFHLLSGMDFRETN